MRLRAKVDQTLARTRDLLQRIEADLAARQASREREAAAREVQRELGG